MAASSRSAARNSFCEGAAAKTTPARPSSAIAARRTAGRPRGAGLARLTPCRVNLRLLHAYFLAGSNARKLSWATLRAVAGLSASSSR